MRKSTTIREWMSRLPIEIEETMTVSEAYEIMQGEGVHHLPVMKGSHLVGLVSLHDLDAARAEGRHEAAVSKIGPRDLYTVPPTERLIAVCAGMDARGVGSAIVVDGSIIVGIFTASDAVRAIAAL